MVALQFPLSLGFPRQEYWSGCHFLLQGIFPTQGSNPHLKRLLHERWILYCSATREAEQILGLIQSVESLNKKAGKRIYSLCLIFFFFFLLVFSYTQTGTYTIGSPGSWTRITQLVVLASSLQMTHHEISQHNHLSQFPIISLSRPISSLNLLSVSKLLWRLWVNRITLHQHGGMWSQKSREDNTCGDTFEDFGPLARQLRHILRDSEDAVKQSTGHCGTCLTLILCAAIFPPTVPTPASLGHFVTPLYVSLGLFLEESLGWDTITPNLTVGASSHPFRLYSW